MAGAIILSVLVHVLAILAFIDVSRDRQATMMAAPVPSDQPPIEVEILADPSMGTPGEDETTEAGQVAITPPPQQAERAETSTASQIAETPPPEPSPENAVQSPVPPPSLAPAASRPVPSAKPALPASVRAGSSLEGRPDGTTDIILGTNTVPAGPDPGQYNIPPRYPREAAQRGQQGMVRLSVVVGTDGTALSVDVLESSGHPLLDRAARDAVWKWRFRPARDGGLAIPSTIPVTLSFVLEERR